MGKIRLRMSGNGHWWREFAGLMWGIKLMDGLNQFRWSVDKEEVVLASSERQNLQTARFPKMVHFFL